MGNSKTTFATLGASSHSSSERHIDDYYASNPIVAAPLMRFLEEEGLLSGVCSIWECACGEGHLSRAIENCGYDVFSSDLVDRGYGIGRRDFLLEQKSEHKVIITNPPFKLAQEFCTHALDILPDGGVCAVLLRIQFLEGQKREALFKKYPLKSVLVFAKRVKCAINGDFNATGSGAMCYAAVIRAIK